jgi:transposase
MLRRQQALIDGQRQTLAELGREKQALLHRMAQLLRRLYGRRSERLDAAQLLLFGQAIESIEAAQAAAGEAGAGEAGAAAAPDSPARRRGRPHGRRPLPAHLPRHRLEHPVAPGDLLCPCGCTRRHVRYEVSEQLEYAPACLFVLQHARPVMACPNPDCTHSPAVVIADKPPQPIEKGLPGPGLIAHVITSKYADHLPLYRLEGMLARHGVDLDRSTLGGWVEAAADLLLPLVLLMASLIRRSKVIGTDDTTVPVLDKGGDKTRTGHLWVYRGDGSFPYTAFDYSPDHGGEWPQKFLAGFGGYLQADAFSGYDALYASGKVIEVGCMAHARRKFYEAKDSDPVPTHEALALIRRLYEVEDKAKDLDAASRLAMRQGQSVPVLNDLHAWLLKQQTRCLPKSPLGGAIGYALNQWAALCRYASDGDLEIDNNATERAIRGVAIGRNNWTFFGSDNGGNTAAVLRSFVASCQRNKVDPFSWLKDVLSRIADHPITRLAELLPHNWASAQA